MHRLSSIVLLMSLAAAGNAARAHGRPPRPTPPTRDPNTPGYAGVMDLPDAALPPADAGRNFILGPTRDPAPGMSVRDPARPVLSGDRGLLDPNPVWGGMHGWLASNGNMVWQGYGGAQNAATPAPRAELQGVVVPAPPPPPATDAEALTGRIEGAVAGLDGTEIVLALPAPFVPRIGDSVEVYEQGSGGAPFVGWWNVAYAEGDTVRAKPGKSFRAPARGMKAVVFAGLPCCLKVPFNLALGRPDDPADLCGEAARLCDADHS